ncbi:MAG: hypothetical protein WBL95_25190 [Microcoleus sp.]
MGNGCQEEGRRKKEEVSRQINAPCPIPILFGPFPMPHAPFPIPNAPCPMPHAPLIVNFIN